MAVKDLVNNKPTSVFKTFFVLFTVIDIRSSKGSPKRSSKKSSKRSSKDHQKIIKMVLKRSTDLSLYWNYLLFILPTNILTYV